MRRSRACVYTAMFDRYDRIVDHVPQAVDCDVKVFTDGTSEIDARQMEVVVRPEPAVGCSPVLRNVRFRLFPFDVPELDGYEILIEEARVSRSLAKFRHTDRARQVDAYRRTGFPADAGLYWNGFMVFNRRGDRARMRRFQETYWKEMIAYNTTDDAHPQGQVSLPYCLWQSGLKLITVPPLYRSGALEIRPHLK